MATPAHVRTVTLDTTGTANRIFGSDLDSSGNLFVLYERGDPSGFTKLVKYDSSGNPITSVTVNTPSVSHGDSGSVNIDTNNKVVVTYDKEGTSIGIKRYNNDLSVDISESTISSTTGAHACRLDSNNDAYISYRPSGTSYPTVKKFTMGTTTFTTALTLESNACDSINMESLGDFIIVLHRRATGTNIYGTKINTTPSIEAGPTNLSGVGCATFFDLNIDPSSNIFIYYVKSSDADVYYQKYTCGGASFTSVTSETSLEVGGMLGVRSTIYGGLSFVSYQDAGESAPNAYFSAYTSSMGITDINKQAINTTPMSQYEHRLSMSANDRYLFLCFTPADNDAYYEQWEYNINAIGGVSILLSSLN